MGIWGAILTLGAGAFSVYLAYYVLHRASIYGELSVRMEEIIPFGIGLLLFVGGLALAFGAYQSLTTLDHPGLLADPATKIVGVRRVVNRGGRFLAIKLESGIEIRWKFTALLVDEKAEIAAVGAVELLPQWVGRAVAGAAPRKAPMSQEAALAAIRADIAARPGPDDGKRIAVDAPFSQIAHAMQTAGLTLKSHMEEGVALDPKPRDPIRAEYVANGARAIYVRSGDTGLQTVQVVGEHAAAVFNDILNIGYLPVLEGKIAPMLESGDRAAILRALGAIEFVHAGKPGRFYADALASLSAHPDPEIRDAALRAGGSRG